VLALCHALALGLTCDAIVGWIGAHSRRLFCGLPFCPFVISGLHWIRPSPSARVCIPESLRFVEPQKNLSLAARPVARLPLFSIGSQQWLPREHAAAAQACGPELHHRLPSMSLSSVQLQPTHQAPPKLRPVTTPLVRAYVAWLHWSEWDAGGERRPASLRHREGYRRMGYGWRNLLEG
jgi:hypothetical protein